MRLARAPVIASISFLLLACSTTPTTTRPVTSRPLISPEAKRLLKRAEDLELEGKFIAAARTAELGLEASHNALPINTEDALRLEIAKLYMKGGSSNDAIRVLKTLVEHTPSMPEEQLLHAQASHLLARILYENAQLQEASRHVASAESLTREIDQPSLLFQILGLASAIASNLGHDTEVIRTLNEVLAILPRVEEPPPQARLSALGLLFYIYKDLKRYADAEAVASEYLKEAEKLGDLGQQATALELQGTLKYEQEKLSEAAEAFFAAARKASEKRDREGAKRYLEFGLGILEELKDYEQMIEVLVVALDRYDQVFKDPRDKAYLLLTLGEVFKQRDEYGAAYKSLYDAYQLYRDVGADNEAARAVVEMGMIMKELGDLNVSYAHFTAGKEHASKAQNMYFLGVIHKYLGILYEEVGGYVDAFEEYEAARKIYRTLDEPDLLYSVEHLTMGLYQKMGDKNKIREQLLRLEQYRNVVPSLKKEFLYWIGLSHAYFDLGEKQKAKEYASRALMAAREAEDTDGQIQSLNTLALYIWDKKSIPLLKEAYAIAQKTDAASYYGPIQSTLGRIFLGKGMVKEAIEAFTASIASTEEMVGHIPYSQTRVSFTAKSLSPYDGLIEALFLLYERRRDPRLAEEALLVHERSRAREFARTLTRNRMNEIAKMLPQELFAEENLLAGEIDKLEREVYKLYYAYGQNERLLERKDKELESKRERYATLMNTIQARYPEYVIAKRRDLGNVGSLPIRPDEALLVYRITSVTSKVTPGVFIWVITASESSVEIQSFERINTDFPRTGRKALDGFRKDDPQRVSQDIWKALSEKLLGSALNTISSVSHITVVRDHVLVYMPFEMLPVPGDSKLLVLDRWTVGYYPSLLSLVVNRSSVHSQKEFGKKVLLVGDVDYRRTSDARQKGVHAANRVQLRSGGVLGELPYSATEIDKIGELFRSRQIPTTIFRRMAASEFQIKGLNLQEYRYLHFAVHGLLANEVFGVGEPSLALASTQSSDDSFLRASEVMGLKLNAELVVLSACRTALGEYHAGEGIGNLARAFMSAGAESVIVSQWAVADQSTAELMVELYKNLDRGLSVQEALRAAKITLRRRYKSPYYWAPFIQVGG